MPEKRYVFSVSTSEAGLRQLKDPKSKFEDWLAWPRDSAMCIHRVALPRKMQKVEVASTGS